jgi:hypothetical protein
MLKLAYEKHAKWYRNFFYVLTVLSFALQFLKFLAAYGSVSLCVHYKQVQ